MLLDKKNLDGCLARSSVQFLEADVLAVLPEALAAHVEAVLLDQTVTIGARAASARALSVFARPGVTDVVETHFDEKKVFRKDLLQSNPSEIKVSKLSFL
jgi:hypothetical protein